MQLSQLPSAVKRKGYRHYLLVSRFLLHLSQLRKKNQALVEMYREKCKKFSQITNLYNLAKSRAMRSQMQTAVASQALNSLDGPRAPVALVANPSSVSAHPQTQTACQQRAYSVDLERVEQLHRHQRGGTGSLKGKQAAEAAAMLPPSRPIATLGKGDPPIATPSHRTRLSGPSRPSTRMSQLPSDSIMTGRFHTERPPMGGYTNGHHSAHRENLNLLSHRSADIPSRIRSFFSSTIT
ncbi:hypothetical protein BJX63DRAFT_361754 [Aspergillus granulosus]|uniref:Uncharacterized protein n=1 Tax=Aspergillus granulosus TaxID=176169 RepID=A0ABR4HYG6_9EURO